MNTDNPTSAWQQWVVRPQRLPWRKLLFQVHLWSAITLGLYIFFISVTGSVLVYRNELYLLAYFEPPPLTSAGPALDETTLKGRVESEWPGYRVDGIRRFSRENLAVEVRLDNGGRPRLRYVDPNTGEDLGTATDAGVKLVTGLIDLHRNFLAGQQGRRINGIIASAVLLVILTGLVIWWPGKARWKHSVRLRRGVGWRRLVWDLHSMTGIWTAGFMFILTVSGLYLCFPQAFHGFADTLQPPTTENAGARLVDRMLYWLAFLHFGRINGIGLPCDGPGVCDQTVKATWAFFGLAPALMFVSGVVMWWNRQVRRWYKRHHPH